MKKIFITGAHGMLGTALTEHLHKTKKYKIYNPTSKALNLLDKKSLKQYFNLYGPFDCVFHLAAKVGGVKGNTDYVADFFDQNTQLNLNIFEVSKDSNTKKIVSVLSTCIYPDSDYVKYPLTEEQLHLGPPHISNFGYAYAKRMIDVQSRAYRQQFGLNAVCAIPNNLFGPNDSYDTKNGHVIPSLIKKIHKAKMDNIEKVEIWGSGRPLREFTYSKDTAALLEILMNEYDGEEPINIGNPNEFSIKDVAYKIKQFIGYNGELFFNTNMPEGQFRKNSSNKKLLEKTSWKNEKYTLFDKALKESCDWFIDHYPNVRM